MWIADMNFPTVPTIAQAIIERAKHPAFGYFQMSDEYFDAIADLKLSQPNSLQANPNYGPLSDSPLRGAASFTDPLVANGFDEVTYIGAFADENDGWMSGWTEFDPQNKAY